MFRALLQVLFLLLVGCILIGVALVYSTTTIHWLMPEFAQAKHIEGNLWQGFELTDFKMTHPKYGELSADKIQLKADWWGTLRYGWHHEQLPIYLETLSATHLVYTYNAIQTHLDSITLDGYRLDSHWVVKSLRIDGPKGQLFAQGDLDWLHGGSFNIAWKDFAFFMRASNTHNSRGNGTLTLQCKEACHWHLHFPTIEGLYQGQPISGFFDLAWHQKQLDYVHTNLSIGKNSVFVKANFATLAEVDWNIDLKSFKFLNQNYLYNAKSHGTWRQITPDQATLNFTVDNRANHTALNFRSTQLDRQNDVWHVAGQGSLGTGTFSLTGDVDLTSHFPAYTLHLEGNKLVLSNTPFTKLIASPDLLFKKIPDGPPIIHGNITVDNSMIRLKGSGAHLTQSKDIQLIGTESSPLLPTNTPSKLSSHLSPVVNVTLFLSPNNQFEGLGLKTHLQGKVQLQQAPHQGTLNAIGKIQLEKGVYDGYSRKLNLVDSYLMYNGQSWLNPTLNVNAQRNINNAPEVNSKGQLVVGIHISGDIDTPVLDFYSTPSLPQDEVLSYLLFGKGTQQASQAQAEMMFDAFNQLTHWFDGGGKQNQIASALQLDEIRVSTAGTGSKKTKIGTKETLSPLNDVSVILGKQITEQIYLNYQLGLGDTLSNVQLHYLIGRHFELQASTDGENSGADLIWFHDR